jgi:hypothetical protein
MLWTSYPEHASMRTFRTGSPSRLRGLTALWSTLIVVTVVAVLIPGVPAGLGRESGSTTGGGGDVHRYGVPIPLFPVHIRPIGVTVPAVVDPTDLYHSEPAPMGIGDFGVGESGRPYTYNTSEFVGNFSWQSLHLLNGSDSEFTDQLNVVLQFAQGGTTYAYWIQDVAFMNSTSGDLQFENNIWNFTTSQYCLSSSAVQGNGSVYSISGCEGYYAVEAVTQPGANQLMPSPGDFSLVVRSYRSAGGLPEVAFEYWDGVTSYEVSYDNVVWPWATAVSADRNFYVDGNATAPSGNFYDAELSLGGPGGGAATGARSVTDASSRLLYWNGHNLEAPRSVWNFGGDTAEAISNVQSFFSHEPDGLPLTTQLNGTSRNATPARAYDQGRVGVLAISDPSISAGTVSVAGTPWDFAAGQANLTLVPGVYTVWVNSTTEQHNLGSCAISGGHTLTVIVPGTCSPMVTTPIGTPASVDVGQTVVFRTTLTAVGSGGDTFNWSSLAAGLGCRPSANASISCAPNLKGTYTVAVTATDSSGNSNTSGPLRYTVDSDPVVGSPGGSPGTVETGAAVTFTATPSGGSGNFTYLWAGLPMPCTGTLSSAPVCRPAMAGGYSVSVTVTDSNGDRVTSSPLAYEVAAGPSVSPLVATPPTSIDLGESVNFSATAHGGTGSYTYTWQGLPAGCTSVDAPSFVCRPSAAGTSSVTLEVIDADGGQASSAPLSFSVYAPLQLGALTVSPHVTDLGGNVTFSTSGVIGGSGSYTYTWSGLPGGCVATDGASVTCRPNETGTFQPVVVVRDPDGGNVSGTASLTVLPAPAVGNIGASRPSADIGQRIEYSLEGVSGGGGGYRYAWAGLPMGCVSSNATSLFCTPNGAGTFAVTGTVTDEYGFSGESTLEYTVFPLPTVTAPNASTSTPYVGQTFELTSNVTSGSGHLRIVWSGLPPGCGSVNLSTLNCTPSLNGTFLVVVTVEDSNGGSVTSSPLSLRVVPRSPEGSASWAAYVLEGGLAVLAALVATTVIWASRRKRSPPSRPA